MYHIVVGIILILWSIASEAQVVTLQQAVKETYIEGLQLLPSTSGINVGFVKKNTKLGKYQCGAMSLSEASTAINNVARALRAIPKSQIHKVRPKYLILCSHTLASGVAIGGLPIPPLNLLMLDAVGAAQQVRHTFLHELFHLIEYRHKTFKDTQWQRQFGKGYKNSYQGALVSAPIGSGEKGFVSAYAETYPHEDRAELFAFLLLQEHKLHSINDPTLKRKIQYIGDKCYRLLGWRL